nr:hypothetical protein [Tanacetum cinerariifolium]
MTDHADSILETSIDKLFDEGGSGSQAGQGDSTGFGEKTNRKKKTVVADAGGSSHPLKKLREDHETLSGPSVAGKSRFAVQRLLVEVVLNAEVSGEPIPTFPFVTSSVSATPEREGGDHTDSVTGLNLRTISAPQRFGISLDSSHHSGANVAEAEVDSLVRSSVPVMTVVTTTTSTVDAAMVVKEKNTKSSLFAVDSSFAGGADPNVGVFLDLTESDFLSVNNGSRLNDGRVCHEMVDEFAPLKFFVSVRGMEHDQLFTEFNVRAAHQMSLSTEIRMRAEYNIKEKRGLKSAVDEKIELLKVREKEVEDLKAQLLLKEVKAAEAIRLHAKASKFKDVKVTGLEASAMGKDRELTDLNAQLTFVHELEVASFGLQEKLSSYEYLTERLEEFQDAQLKIVNDNFDKLYADFVEMALHLEERVAIGKAIEKGMQDGLSFGITHGAEGRVLTYVTAFNPSAEADYISALQHLQNTLAERLGLTESQPHVDQLMVPIHHSPDKVVIGATALSLSLLVPTKVLTGVEGTSDIMPATDVTTMAMSTTLTSASTVPPISVDDNEVVGMDDQTGADGNRILFLIAFVTSYDPSHLGPSFPVSSVWLASLLRYTRSRLIPRASLFYTKSTSAVLSVGMPISTGMTASVSYVNENGMSSLLDFIIAWCAHKTRGSSSIQLLLLASILACIPSPKLQFALSTRPLDPRVFLSKHSLPEVAPHIIAMESSRYLLLLPPLPIFPIHLWIFLLALQPALAYSNNGSCQPLLQRTFCSLDLPLN